MSGLGVALLVAAALVTAPRAQSRMIVDAPGAWKPWKFTAIPSARRERSATAAEVKAFEGQLLALNAILQRASGVATPRGFSVETWGSLAGYSGPAPGQPNGTAIPLAGALDFGAFPIFEYERGGKTIREDTGETALLLFHVNDLSAGMIAGDRVPDWIGADAEAYMQPPAHGEIAGFPRYGDILVITKHPKSIWAPVSMEQAIGFLVAAHRKDLDDSREAVDRFRVSLADSRNPAKRAQRLAGYKEVAALQPNPAKFLAEMDEVQKQVEADIEKELAPGGGGVMTMALGHERDIADAAAWLTELSPGDRAAPACYAKAGALPRQRFRSTPDAGCVPLVQPNWAFFDTSLPRSAPQVLVIPQVSRCFDNQPANPPTPAGCPTNRQLILTMDRQAVLDWLK
ncbi:MAG: hypothetical protein IT180_12070 [Acidobacteria bacterium]|nr:hypothetical protein [Acidobacteriota bacterium]